MSYVSKKLRKKKPVVKKTKNPYDLARLKSFWINAFDKIL